jgi:hypothetical protein
LDERDPGASRNDETRVLAELLQRMPANIPVLGYPWAGDGHGVQERPGVNLFSRTGKFLVPSEYTPNLSVLTATRAVSQLRQPLPRDIKFEQDKVYVALTMSDGDNLNVFYDRNVHVWSGERDDQPPIGWTLGPSASDFYPAVVDWYYRRLTPHDHLQCAVSGIGYVYPDHYGEAFTDRQRVLDEFCSLTDRYMRRLDQRTVWSMGASDATLSRMVANMPTATAVFADYGRLPGANIDNSTAGDAGKPIFHVLVDGRPRGFELRLREAVGPRRPAFVHAFLFNWNWRLADASALQAALPDDFMLVRPDELAQLYNRWRAP